MDKNDPGAMVIPFSGAFEAKLLEMGYDSSFERPIFICYLSWRSVVCKQYSLIGKASTRNDQLSS